MTKQIKVILPASEIPLGSTVTKRTGTYAYTISDSIIIYREKGGEKQVIKAEAGGRFLISESTTGSIDSINGSTELVWITDYRSLVIYLEDEIVDAK